MILDRKIVPLSCVLESWRHNSALPEASLAERTFQEKLRSRNKLHYGHSIHFQPGFCLGCLGIFFLWQRDTYPLDRFFKSLCTGEQFQDFIKMIEADKASFSGKLWTWNTNRSCSPRKDFGVSFHSFRKDWSVSQPLRRLRDLTATSIKQPAEIRGSAKYLCTWANAVILLSVRLVVGLKIQKPKLDRN